jgi:hypothetical protein
MKLFTLLALLCLVPTLYGCPKKNADGGAAVEPVEGSSSSDKSGEGTTEEMQEKKGGDAPASDASPAEEKK